MIPNDGTRIRVVYDLIVAAGGLTAEQVDDTTGWGHQSTSAAVARLKRDGLVIPLRDADGGYVRRVTRSGGLAHVMVSVE